MNEEYIKQVLGYLMATALPTFYALIGRLAHYAHLERWPSWAETGREAIIVIFMGVCSGGLGEYLGLKGYAFGAFVSSTSFFGPRIVFMIFGKYFGHQKVKDSCDIEMMKRKRK